MNKYHLLTIASVGLFIGFFLGYYVFASVHLTVYCMPSGRLILDKNLLREIILNLDVSDCQSISFRIQKTTPTEVIFGSQTPYVDESTPSPSGETPMGPGGAVGGAQPTQGGKTETTPPSEHITGGSYPMPNATEPQINLKIFDICAASINPNDYPDVADCMGGESPYYTVIEATPSEIRTSFYGNVGFNGTYPTSNPTHIFYVYVGDLYSLSDDIQAVDMYGDLKPYFSIGAYSVSEVLQPESMTIKVQRNMTNVKVLSFPLSVGNLPTTGNWSQMSFYVRTSKNLYPVGSIWVFS
jgi:hypothetical protein